MKAGVMVLVYIACCLRVATRPCKYFQLNARFFDDDAGIFSKVALDRLIPREWKLAQGYDDGAAVPSSWPVFVKPEWSQNARGVHRADNAAELQRIRERYTGDGDGAKIKYLLQQGAMEQHEYEIFSVADHRDRAKWSVLTVTQACNDSEAHPVNSIYNPNTRYRDITGDFTAAELDAVWAMVRRIGAFAISRVSVRADSVADLLAGKFHIIEVNLFLPMPINLLDPKHATADILRFITNCMMRLALATKHRDRNVKTRPVFVKSMLYNRRSYIVNFIRARL